MGLVVFVIIGLVIGVVIGFQLGNAPRGALPAVIGLTGGVIGGIAGAALSGMDPLTQVWSLPAWAGAVIGAVVLMTCFALIAAPGGNPSQGMTGTGDRSTSGRGTGR